MTRTNTSPISFKTNGNVTLNNTVIGKWDSFSGVYDVEHFPSGDFSDGLTREDAIQWFEKLENLTEDS